MLALVLLTVGPWLFIRLRPDPPDPVGFPALDSAATEHRIYVIDWGYHTSIVVPQLPGVVLAPSNARQAQYVEFAWGDRSFYMESNYWPHRLLATLLLPTSTVTYLAGWQRAPARSDGMRGLWSRTVTTAELSRLYSAVEGSIRHRAGAARVDEYPPAEGYRGRFLPAHGYYLFWSDCNRWTVDQLHRAGLAESGTGVIFSGQVGGRLTGFTRE